MSNCAVDDFDVNHFVQSLRMNSQFC
jgi:hypothetical protein